MVIMALGVFGRIELLTVTAGDYVSSSDEDETVNMERSIIYYIDRGEIVHETCKIIPVGDPPGNKGYSARK